MALSYIKLRPIDLILCVILMSYSSFGIAKIKIAFFLNILAVRARKLQPMIMQILMKQFWGMNR